jgi:hypothetical protein
MTAKIKTVVYNILKLINGYQNLSKIICAIVIQFVDTRLLCYKYTMYTYCIF